MTRRVLALACASLLSSTLTVSADPVTLASRSIVETSTAPTAQPDTGHFILHRGLSSGVDLFEQFAITVAVVGSTLTVTAADDDDFAAFAGALTNNRPNFVGFLFESGGQETRGEGVLFGLPAGKTDFAGSLVSSLTLRVLDFSTRPSMQFPGATEEHLSAVLSVLGTPGPSPTPEPGTLVLLGSGLAAFGRAGWRHVRRRAA